MTCNQTSIAQVVEKIADEKRDTLRLFPDRVAEARREAVRRELQFDESLDVLRPKGGQIDLLRQPARLQLQFHFPEGMAGQKQIRWTIGSQDHHAQRTAAQSGIRQKVRARQIGPM